MQPISAHCMNWQTALLMKGRLLIIILIRFVPGDHGTRLGNMAYFDEEKFMQQGKIQVCSVKNCGKCTANLSVFSGFQYCFKTFNLTFNITVTVCNVCASMHLPNFPWWS